MHGLLEWPAFEWLFFVYQLYTTAHKSAFYLRLHYSIDGIYQDRLSVVHDHD